MSNMNGDLLDDGLQAVMGKERCQDVYGKGDGKKEKVTPRNDLESRKAKREAEKAADAEWNAVPTYAPNWFDRLKGCARYAMVCGGLVALFGYWHISGQMDASAAVPCMVACGCIGGFKIGNVCRK